MEDRVPSRDIQPPGRRQTLQVGVVHGVSNRPQCLGVTAHKRGAQRLNLITHNGLHGLVLVLELELILYSRTWLTFMCVHTYVLSISRVQHRGICEQFPWHIRKSINSTVWPRGPSSAVTEAETRAYTVYTVRTVHRTQYILYVQHIQYNTV